MGIAVIVAVVSVGLVISIALYIAVTCLKAAPGHVSRGQGKVPATEGRPVVLPATPALTRGPDTVQPEPPESTIEPEAITPVGHRESPAVQEPETPVGLEVPQAVPEPVQKKEPQPERLEPGQTQALAPPTALPETVEPQEPEISFDGTSEVELEHPLMGCSPGGEGERVGASITPDAATGVKDDVNQTSVTESSPEEREEQEKRARKTGRVSPEKRGGRPRREEEGDEEEKTGKSPQRSPKPEIVCCKREREWILGVEIPEGLQGALDTSVFQDNVRLTQDTSKDGCWQLAKLGGEVVVRISEGQDGDDLRIELRGDDYLLFKLRGASLNEGCRVRQPSSGSYLVVAPDSWERDEERAGTAPYTPERVCLEGYQAHFFDVPGDSASRIAFRDHAGHLLEIGSMEPRFELVGQEVPDASEYSGSLFGVSPPRIRVKDGSWADVGAIVLGEEGSGRGRWRESFKPNLTLLEQNLPEEIAARKAGWYFLRFYDLQDELIDSFDFRFVAGLKGITVHEAGPFPSAAGHDQATVEFEHDAESYVEPSSAGTGDVRIDRTPEKTILTIPPVPAHDRSLWLVGPRDGPHVEVTVLLQRIWWAVSEGNQPAMPWQGTCLPLSPKDLTATSNTVLWIQFPTPRWTDGVLVGFKQENRRSYRMKVTERTLQIPLRDFSDSQQLTDRTTEHLLTIWVNVDGAFCEAAVATLPAEDVPDTLDITHIPAYRLAAVLTTLRRATRGPLRQLLKEVRRHYRRARRSRPERNDEFKKEGLCAIAVFLQLAGSRQSIIPKGVSRWRSKARLGRHEFPETAREVWGRYNELENRSGRGKGRRL